ASRCQVALGLGGYREKPRERLRRQPIYFPDDASTLDFSRRRLGPLELRSCGEERGQAHAMSIGGAVHIVEADLKRKRLPWCGDGSLVGTCAEHADPQGWLRTGGARLGNCQQQ